MRDDGAVATTIPSGTVTFLFTDIEGSTRLWEAHTAEMEAALERHDEIMRAKYAALMMGYHASADLLDDDEEADGKESGKKTG